MKRVVKTLTLIVLILTVGLVGGIVAAYYVNRPSSTIPEAGALVSVHEGESLNAIAAKLEGEGIIRSSFFLRLFSRLRATEGDFQVGTYKIEKGTSTLGVHNLLVSGREVLYSITIPEGWPISRIANLLEDESITSRDEFLAAARARQLLADLGIPGDSVEGFLFPDTYFFAKDYPAELIVKHMVEQFFGKLRAIYPDFSGIAPEELYQKVVLASIIEREYRAEDEAEMMASVFYNRLDINMRLQSCATVAYVLTEILGKEHPDNLTFKDLEVESDYNTYAQWGLPPGPISNPGIVALKAAFLPAESDFLYFVLKDPNAGRHEFSTSLEDHNYAKFMYLKKS